MKSITLLTEWNNMFQMLETADAGALILHIFSYAESEERKPIDELNDLSAAAKILYVMVVNKLERVKEQRIYACEKGREKIAEKKSKNSPISNTRKNGKNGKNDKKGTEKNTTKNSPISNTRKSNVIDNNSDDYEGCEKEVNSLSNSNSNSNSNNKKKSVEKENTLTPTNLEFDEIQLRGNLLGCLSQFKSIKDKEMLMVKAGEALLKEYPAEEEKIVDFIQWWGQQSAIPGQLMCERENGFNTLLRYKQWRKK